MKMKLGALLSIREVAELMTRHRSTIWRWVNNNEFPQPIRHKNGNTIGWPESVIQQWLSDNSK